MYNAMSKMTYHAAGYARECARECARDCARVRARARECARDCARVRARAKPRTIYQHNFSKTIKEKKGLG